MRIIISEDIKEVKFEAENKVEDSNLASFGQVVMDMDQVTLESAGVTGEFGKRIFVFKIKERE